MKHQIVAVALGSLFALPAVANYEIDAGHAPGMTASSKTRADVRAELIAAQRAGQVVENAELGTLATQGQGMQRIGKSREDVRAEVESARRAGNIIMNAELGTSGQL